MSIPGFDALGRQVLGQISNPSPVAPTFSPPPFSNWSAPRRAAFAVVVITTTTAGFVAPPPVKASQPFTQFSPPQRKAIQQASWGFQPPAIKTQTAIFSGFSEPVRSRINLPDEQFSTLFEELSPLIPPFIGFARFEFPIRAKANIGLLGFENFVFIPAPPDTHDGGWVKRKKRLGGLNPLDLELEERSKRRAAIERAIYGPEVTYEPAPSPIVELPKPPPNTEDLTRIVMQLRTTEFEAKRHADDQDDEDVLEMILRDL